MVVLGAKYLGFFSSRSLKTREKYISFAQFVYFLREVCLLFNFIIKKLKSKHTSLKKYFSHISGLGDCTHFNLGTCPAILAFSKVL